MKTVGLIFHFEPLPEKGKKGDKKTGETPSEKGDEKTK